MINPDHEEGGRLGAVWGCALLAAGPLTCLFALVVGAWWERCDIGLNSGVRTWGLVFDVMPPMAVFFALGGLAAVIVSSFRSWSARKTAGFAAAVLAAVFWLGLGCQEWLARDYPNRCGAPATGRPLTKEGRDATGHSLPGRDRARPPAAAAQAPRAGQRP